MNLIVSKRLDQSERKAIQELTLKKRQSKKSTMTQRQLMARQQLARELMRERVVPISLDETKYYCLCDQISDDNNESYNEDVEDKDQVGNETNCVTSNRRKLKYSQSYPSSIANTNLHNTSPRDNHSNSTSSSSITTATTTVTTTSSDSSAVSAFMPGSSSSEGIGEESYSLTRTSSGFSGTGSLEESRTLPHNQNLSHLLELNSTEELKREAQISCKKKHLKELYGELNKKLEQYEYLVSQEKALLSAHNINLITSESVNNFHLHQQLSGDLSTRRNRSIPKQLSTQSSTPQVGIQESPPLTSSQAGSPNLRMTLC